MDSLGLESQATVNHLVWVGEADSDPLQAPHMFNHCAPSPAPKNRLLQFLLHLFTVVCMCVLLEDTCRLCGIQVVGLGSGPDTLRHWMGTALIFVFLLRLGVQSPG